jgi:hypothetical protein
MSENADAAIASPSQKPRNSFPAWRLPNGTINASDFQLEAASSSCGTWEWGCAAVVVVAVLAEFLIAFIHPPYDSALNEAGTVFADAAIAFGIVGEVIFGRLDARIQTELRGRSDNRLANAAMAAGEAHARALEAELELQKIKSAKILPIFRPFKWQDRLKPFAGMPYFIMACDQKYLVELANELKLALDWAGWVPARFSEEYDWDRVHVAPGIVGSRVRVEGATGPTGGDAAKEISEILSEETWLKARVVVQDASKAKTAAIVIELGPPLLRDLY